VAVFVQAGNNGADVFSVQGDGRTTVAVTAKSVSAVVADSAHETYTGDVFVAKAARASSAEFFFLKVRGFMYLFAVIVFV
jgi:hypothetical protein